MERLSSRKGSSPLARGLRAPSPWPRRFPWDHPRSRGVYVNDAEPLSDHLGIIPARAGFTRSRAHRPLTPPDHPRSRGVYRHKTGRGDVAHGSSPLARGLLFGRFSTFHGKGSSPLARGLQRLRSMEARGRRIIPARAGFTPTARRRPTGQRDHPRSRGVYCAARDEILDPWGSSPLARGLPGSEKLVDAVDRIIPARAGFTVRTPRRSIPVPDHPRSRGVYTSEVDMAINNRGSSPLARGLPCLVRPDRHALGIIPARAGFTSSSPWG